MPAGTRDKNARNEAMDPGGDWRRRWGLAGDSIFERVWPMTAGTTRRPL